MKISACIITYNEEKNIEEALQSVAWADEILVVDSESSDKTRELAENFGARVLTQKWLGFGRQKQFAVENASFDWIFSLDADERVSPELKNKILQLKTLPEEKPAKGYKMPRLTYYMNRPIRHGAWYPDWQLRFFHRGYGKWRNSLVHESVAMNPETKIEKLNERLLHFSNLNAAAHHRLIGERYAPLAAREMFAQGKRTSILKITTAGAVNFLQNYLLKRGFLDGFPGFCVATFAAYHAYLKHLQLWEMQTGQNQAPVVESETES